MTIPSIYLFIQRIDTNFCGKTLGCLRTPRGCHNNTDCNYLLTFNKTDTSVEFSLSGKAEGWVSVGLNAKPKMVSKIKVYLNKLLINTRFTCESSNRHFSFVGNIF